MLKTIFSPNHLNSTKMMRFFFLDTNKNAGLTRITEGIRESSRMNWLMLPERSERPWQRAEATSRHSLEDYQPNTDEMMGDLTRNSQTFRILYWNANGVKNHIPKLTDLLLRRNIHVALICETHLKPNHKIKINNYTTYRMDRQRLPREKASGGTAVCVLNTLAHQETNMGYVPPGSRLEEYSSGATYVHKSLP